MPDDTALVECGRPGCGVLFAPAGKKRFCSRDCQLRARPGEDMRQLVVRLPESLYEAVKKKAVREDRSMAAVIRRALRASLEEK